MNSLERAQKDIALAKKISIVKMKMLSEHPFFGLLCSKLDLAIDTDCETACTDGKTIYFGEKFSDRLNTEELSFIIMHEIMHVVAGHCFRSNGYDNFLYNIAADVVVNSIILDELGVPELDVDGSEVMHYAPNGKEGRLYTAEQVYDMIVDHVDVNSSKSKGSECEESEKRSGGNDRKNLSEDGKNPPNGDKNSALSNDRISEDNKDETVVGSSDGVPDIYADGFFDDHSKWGTLENPTYNELRIKQRVYEVYLELKDTDRFGSIPNMAQRIVEQVQNPPIDWKSALNDFIQKEVNDYSFSPPDKRFSESDFFLPDFNDAVDKIENVYIAVDASGSINNKELSLALNEIKGAIDQFNDKFNGWISYFDFVVSDPAPFENLSDVSKQKPIGLGGTNFTAVFEKAKEKFEGDLTCIIVITDGTSKYPDESIALGVPVLWLLNNKKRTPPWGRVIRMENAK